MRIRALLSLALLTTSSVGFAQPTAPPDAAAPQLQPPPPMAGPYARPPYVFAPRYVAPPRQPRVFGISVGVLQTAAEASADIDARGTLAIFARAGLSHRWSLQLDLARTRNEDAAKIYAGTASFAVALSDSSTLVPMLRGGLGLDHARGSVDDSGMHVEGAFVLEARFASGLVLGADLALGARGPFSHRVCYYEAEPDYPFAPGGGGGCDDQLDGTTYRAAKVSLGIAF